MKKVFILSITCFLFLSGINAQVKSNRVINFDDNWLFYLGGFQGAEAIKLDDSQWRKIDLPHDWSIEDNPEKKSPFSLNAISQVKGGFTTGGTAWYRKKFDIAKSDSVKHIIIQFDGIYMNANIYINGILLGNHPYGYTSFYYDITKYLKFGEENLVAVEVRNEGQNSRWYSGSGIYRHVWLKTLNPIHVAQWGTFITTQDVNSSFARINIKTKVVNESHTAAEIIVINKFKSAEGKDVGRTELKLFLKEGETKEINQDKNLNNPQLWTLERPILYKAVTEIYNDEKLVYTEDNNFGIRTISFDPQTGFQLNGKTIKLKGGCVHHDNGPLGSRSYDRAEERKVEILKASGFNAVRCSHNPPASSFLDACDRLGMLVIDEAFDMWNVGKTPYDYHLYFKEWWQKDIESMIYRDRNHPSIILWSIGNEIPEHEKELGFETAKMISGFVKNLDSTRPTLSGVDKLYSENNKDPFFSAIDVGGYNYAINADTMETNAYETDHQRIPKRIMIGTESYPLEAFGSWMAVLDHPYVLGDFVWTAWDYIGEASIGWLGYPQKQSFYPWNLAFCGDIDICGWKRPQSYYRDALWKTNQISIFVKPPEPSFKHNPDIGTWAKWNWHDVLPEWNWEGFENKRMEVSVYSSCDKVELFLNGHTLGVKPTNRSTKYIATYAIPYQAGELKAVGYSDNKIVNSSSINTAFQPSQIRLSTDRRILKANNKDLSYITVELIDKNGNINPHGEHLINFSVLGDGEIIGVGNANPMSLESYQKPFRKTWKGRCIVIVKAGKTPGKIILKASGEQLKPVDISLSVEN